jgi:HPt (histidine-containing phosphotransfer) domain-containing protein
MLIEAFLARTQQPLERLRMAHEAGDRKQVEIQAHALRGLCAALGATRAAALFDRIEHHSANEPRASLDAWVRRASDSIREALKAVSPKSSGDDVAPTEESQAA